MLALRGPGGEKEMRMSGGDWTPPESPGGVSRPKMCIWRSGGPKSIGKHIAPASAGHYFRGKMYIWRSGGPKSMGKHIVPESPPHYFPGNIAIFCIFGFRPQLVPPDCLNHEIHTKPMKNQYIYGLNVENTHSKTYGKTYSTGECPPLFPRKDV